MIHDLTDDGEGRSRCSFGHLDRKLFKKVMGKVVEGISWIDVIALRQVSKQFRTAVDKMKLVIGNCCVEIGVNKITVSLDGHSKVYEHIHELGPPYEPIFCDNLLRAFHDLKIMGNHPNLLIQHFHVDTSSWRESQECDDLVRDQHYFRIPDSVYWRPFVAKLTKHSQFLRVQSMHVERKFFLGIFFFEMTKPHILERIGMEERWHVDYDTFQQFRNAKIFHSSIHRWFFEKGMLNHFLEYSVKTMRLESDQVHGFIWEALDAPNMQNWRLHWKRADPNILEKQEQVERGFGRIAVRSHSDESNTRTWELDWNGRRIELIMGPNCLEARRI